MRIRGVFLGLVLALAAQACGSDKEHQTLTILDPPPSGGNGNGQSPDSTTLTIAFAPSDTTIAANGQFCPRVTVEAGSGVLTSYTLGTSDQNVVTLNGNCVSAVSVGTATITATANGNHSKTASGVVHVVTGPPQEACDAHASLALIAQGSTSLLIGQTVQFGASITNTNCGDQPAQWSSSSPDVASVDHNGLVTAKAVGTTTINVAVGNLHASSTVTVSAQQTNQCSATATLIVTASSTTIQIGNTAQVYGTPSNADCVLQGATNWTSSSSAVATVSSTGVVTGVSAGTVIITGKNGTLTGSTSIVVTAQQVNQCSSNAKLVVTASSTSISVGSSVQASAVPSDPNCTLQGAIVWTSSNSGIATVSSSGVITGVSAGSVVITATNGSLTGSITITVSAQQTGDDFTLTSPTTITLQFCPNGVGNTSANITWNGSVSLVSSVNNQNVLVAPPNGNSILVRPAHLGESDIQLVSKTSGKTLATIHVIVTSDGCPPPANKVFTASLTPGVIQYCPTGPGSTGATITLLPSNATATYSGGGSIASVNSSGAIIATGTGNTTITVTGTGEYQGTVINLPLISQSTACSTPTTVTLTPQNPSISLGMVNGNCQASQQFLATVTGSSAATAWTTSGGTITQNGLFTATAAGTYTITATANRISAQAHVTVTGSCEPTTHTFTVAPSSITLQYCPNGTGGTTQQLALSPSNTTVSYSGGNGIVSVSQSGVVTPLALGNGSFTVTGTGTFTGTSTVQYSVVNSNCVPNQTVTVNVTPKSLNLKIGEMGQLTATVSGFTGTAPAINWVSTLGIVQLQNTTGNTVSIIGARAGRDSIVASAGGGKDFAIVTVSSGVSAIDYTPPGGTIAVNGTQTLTATCTVAGGGSCTPYWYSTDPSRVTVVGAPTSIVIDGFSFPAGMTAQIKGIYHGTADICVQAAVQDTSIKKCYTWTVQ